MRLPTSAFVLASLVLASSAAAQTGTVAVPVDGATTIGAVDVACTGIGLDARNDPRWAGYTVRVELSNARNEYLTGGLVRLAELSGRELVSVTCDAPWILFRPMEGDYRVSAELPGVQAAPRSARVYAPATGQLRVVLQFRDL